MLVYYGLHVLQHSDLAAGLLQHMDLTIENQCKHHFDLDLYLLVSGSLVSVHRGPAMDYRSAEFCVDSSNRFPLKVRPHQRMLQSRMRRMLQSRMLVWMDL